MGVYFRGAGKTVHARLGCFLAVFPGSKLEAFLGPAPPTGDSEFQALFSLVVRTQGNRNKLLAEALASIYMQAEERFEVILCVHQQEPIAGVLQGVRNIVEAMPDEFAAKVRLISVLGGGRSKPLNAGLEAASGKYVCFLDDDDMLLENHFSSVAAALGASENCAYHTFGARRFVTSAPDSGNYPYSTTKIEIYYASAYSLPYQLVDNDIPICNMFVPMEAVRVLGLRFDEDLDVYEDWDFLMRATQTMDIRTVPVVTTVINLRSDQSNTQSDPAMAARWAECRSVVKRRILASPRVLSKVEIEEVHALAERALREDFGDGFARQLVAGIKKLTPEPIKRGVKRMLRGTSEH